MEQHEKKKVRGCDLPLCYICQCGPVYSRDKEYKEFYTNSKKELFLGRFEPSYVTLDTVKLITQN